MLIALFESFCFAYFDKRLFRSSVIKCNNSEKQDQRVRVSAPTEAEKYKKRDKKGMEAGVSSLILSVDAIRTSVDSLIVFKICLIVFSISLIENKISRLQILFSPYRKNFPIREILISPEVMKNRSVLKVRKTGLVSNGGVRVGFRSPS